MARARLIRVLALVVLAGLIGVGIAGPPRARSVLGEVGFAVTDALQDVPEPVIVVVGLLLAVVLWFVFFRWFLKQCYRCWRVVSAWLYRGMTLVLPESPLVKFAAGAMVMIFVVIVIVGVLPALVGDLTASDQGPASYADRLSDQALNTQWSEVIDGDAVGGQPGCDDADAAGLSDRDGDGLPDAWERDGETPNGAALPGASPDRKDLYVQANYGADVQPLDETEKAQLESVWAEMPVENPDGTTGIDLHLSDSGGGAGVLDDEAVFDSRAAYDRYYTEERLGSGHCVYRQVVFGELQMGDRSGVAATPGYAAIVDGSRQPGYAGDDSFRVAITTHELLHATAGRVNGRTHTTEGWLAGGPANEFLSSETAAELNEGGLYGPAS